MREDEEEEEEEEDEEARTAERRRRRRRRRRRKRRRRRRGAHVSKSSAIAGSHLLSRLYQGSIKAVLRLYLKKLSDLINAAPATAGRLPRK